MTPLLLAGLGILSLSACSSFGPSKVRTLADVEPTALPSSSNWFLAASPSILRVESSARIAGDVDRAIAHYDAMARSATDNATRAEAQRRAAYLRLRQDEDGTPESRGALEAAISGYQTLLDEHPTDRNNDLALYQLARALQTAGQPDQATAALRRLQREFPDSSLLNDAVFRLGELEFLQGRYAQAAADYRVVLAAGADAQFFEMAQYKLGWAEFRQSHFASAIELFQAILERELPRQPSHRPSEALAQATAASAPWISDALRVVSLSLAALGGAPALATQIDPPGRQPRFFALIYSALGELFIEKRLHSAAAESFAQFGQRHPQHALAPEFHLRQIQVLRNAGFVPDTLQAMSGFVDRYAPDASYWNTRAADPAVVDEVRGYTDLLARHYQALAQGGGAQAAEHFQSAIHWHQRWLSLFPHHPAAPEHELLLAEALEDSGRLSQATRHYLRAGYDYPGFTGAADAAYAAVLIFQALIPTNTAHPQHAPARQAAIQASVRLSQVYPDHPHWLRVVVRAAEDLAALSDWSQAAEQTQRLLDRAERDALTLEPAVAISARSILADARFALGDYPAAEAAYTALHRLDSRGEILERLALSIYRQGEEAAARDDPRAAAAHFLRIGAIAPQAPIRTQADFDAAAAWLSVGDLAAAEPILEGIVWRRPDHPLVPESRRKLAVVYERTGQLGQAATAFTGIANDTSGSPEMRREAAWHAAELFERADMPTQAVSAYAVFLGQAAIPLDQALRARARLAELSRDRLGNLTEYARWLEELVQAEGRGGQARDERSRRRSAQAALELGRLEAARASGMKIRPPIERSLIARKTQTERALGWLGRATTAGFLETTPAAVFASAVAYADLATALLQADLPTNLSPLEQEELQFLLEDQAFPLEELAIGLHEQNLSLLGDDVWNTWIERSVIALGELVPAQYAPREHLETHYDALP